MRTVAWGPGSATAVFGQVAFYLICEPDQDEALKRPGAVGALLPWLHPFLVLCVPIKSSGPDSAITVAPESGPPNFLLPPPGRAPWERHADAHLLWDPGGLQGRRRNFGREEDKSDPQSLRPQPQGHFSGKCRPLNSTPPLPHSWNQWGTVGWEDPLPFFRPYLWFSNLSF